VGYTLYYATNIYVHRPVRRIAFHARCSIFGGEVQANWLGGLGVALAVCISWPQLVRWRFLVPLRM